ncbi:hypothetical protein EII35_03425 [Arachnia propionica]|uniref:Uncharacterized protein n=1 Tax=Arachnia propionica TaxID=1750 RepID=A0A3P1WX23_9ACTN|nr:hypothetical protein EII35_03425 [Arachnia propionica]
MPSPSMAPDVTTAVRFRAFMVIWVAQWVARLGNGLTAFGLGGLFSGSLQEGARMGASTAVAPVLPDRGPPRLPRSSALLVVRLAKRPS